jgi:hypothetical protein
MTMPQAMLGSAIVAALIALAVARGAAQQAREDEVQVQFDFKGATVTAVLDATPAARDFLSMLPVTIGLEDYASIEKIGYLPRRLTTEGEPAGSQPRAGDFSYYAPRGNLALFHKDFAYSAGLVRLGRITSGLDALVDTGQAEVTIELAD